MPRKSKNRFEVNGDTITIMRDGWDELAFATYREDYFDELSTHTWGLVNGYLYNSTLGGYLHRYMMAKWYSEDVLKDLTGKGYVVDHLNNNHLDCRITNLEFLKKNRNTAKGQYFDTEASQLRERLAVSLFKDFSTGCYQITIGCNDTIVRTDANGSKHYINEIKLLYDKDYPIVILDAEAILTEYESSGRISLSHLRHCDIREHEATILELTEEEKNRAFVFRDGVPYLVIGNGTSLIHTVHYDEGWSPPDGVAE